MVLAVDSKTHSRLRNTLLVTGNIFGDDFGDGDEVLAAERGETGGSRQHLCHMRAQQGQVLPQQRARAADLSVWQHSQRRRLQTKSGSFMHCSQEFLVLISMANHYCR